MPSTVNLNLNSFDNMVSAVRALQAYLSQPVCASIDPQAMGPVLIGLMTYLSTQNAAGQPSGKKWDPAQIPKAVVDHSIPRFIIQLQVAADLT